MRRLLVLFGLTLAACQQAPSTNDANTTNTDHEDASRPNAGSGPFGIAIGTPLGRLRLGEPKGDDPLERPVTPPLTHPDLEYYAVYGTDETGVCKIFAIAKSDENDGTGSGVRSAMDEFAKALATKYGPPTTGDRCVGNEISCQSQFWMMTLMNNERFYTKDWDHPNEAMKAAHIRSIQLFARALDINTSDFVVAFTGDNETECDKFASRAKAKNL